jgi:heptosyltransferase-2
MTAREKVIIIKPGYSETLDPDISGTVSLGDVLRTTVLLHLFPSDRYHVTWVTDKAAWPLLRGNQHIHRVLLVNSFTPFQLTRSHYDIVINLEKDPGICAMADTIQGWKRFGFRFDPNTDGPAGYLESEQAFNIALDPQLKRELGRNWSELLFEMLGAKWNGEQVLLGHYPDHAPKFDVALNYRVGSKFPLKSWPRENWNQLAERFEAQGLSVTWQPAQDDPENIETYIDWIGSAKTLVSCDSLGMHIALALHKPVVALFGPTSSTDVPEQKNYTKMKSTWAADCKPCSARKCVKSEPCMPFISVDDVANQVVHYLNRSASA